MVLEPLTKKSKKKKKKKKKQKKRTSETGKKGCFLGGGRGKTQSVLVGGLLGARRAILGRSWTISGSTRFSLIIMRMSCSHGSIEADFVCEKEGVGALKGAIP